MLVILKNLKIDKIDSIYSGKPGCMCGCRGKYHESELSKKRVLNNMIKYVEQNHLEVKAEFPHIYIDDPEKNYCVYLKEDCDE